MYSRNRGDGPWYYTLGAGTGLSDYWSAQRYTGGLYDLTVHGPNGFMRQFKGDLNKVIAGGANPELRVSYTSASGLQLQLRNSGGAACTITLKPNFYSGEPARTIQLASGASVVIAWSVAASGGWYDLSLTQSADAGWLRRVAGRVENGLPGWSDPAIGQAG